MIVKRKKPGEFEPMFAMILLWTNAMMTFNLWDNPYYTWPLMIFNAIGYLFGLVMLLNTWYEFK